MAGVASAPHPIGPRSSLRQRLPRAETLQLRDESSLAGGALEVRGCCDTSMVNATAPGTDGSERDSLSLEAVDVLTARLLSDLCTGMGERPIAHARGRAAMVRASGRRLVVVVTRGDGCRTIPEPGGVT